LQKRTKKLLLVWFRARPDTRRSEGAKVFCFFFSKERPFSPGLNPRANPVADLQLPL
jgi:hypothetical protein